MNKLTWVGVLAISLTACATVKTVRVTEQVEVAKAVVCTAPTPTPPMLPLTQGTAKEEANILVLTKAAISELYELHRYIDQLHIVIQPCVKFQ